MLRGPGYDEKIRTGHEREIKPRDVVPRLTIIRKQVNREKSRQLPPSGKSQMKRKVTPHPDDVIGTDLLTEVERERLADHEASIENASDHLDRMADRFEKAKADLRAMKRHNDQAVYAGEEPLDLGEAFQNIKDCESNLASARDTLDHAIQVRDQTSSDLEHRRRSRFYSRRAEKVAEVDAVACQLESINAELAELDKEGHSLGIIQPSYMGWLSVKLAAWRSWARQGMDRAA